MELIKSKAKDKILRQEGTGQTELNKDCAKYNNNQNEFKTIKNRKRRIHITVSPINHVSKAENLPQCKETGQKY